MTKPSNKKIRHPAPLTSAFLLKRGFCCGNFCQNCPYESADGTKYIAGTTRVSKKLLMTIKMRKIARERQMVE